jgi:hypothetical protein
MSAPLSHPAVALYLDLLKKSLTGTLFAAEPDVAQEDERRFVHEFIGHYMEGDAVSMLPLARFDNLQRCLTDVLEKNVPGDCIETGVWRGGAVIFMRALLRAAGVTDRLVWVADSFEGLPEPDPEKYPIEAKAHAGPVIKKAYKNFAAGLEEVRANFRAYGLLDDQVRFLPGWFKDTLPTAPIPRLALLRLDGDYYESTMDSLVHLYDKLSPGGYAIIDDYGESTWTYCRQAVDTFRDQRHITTPLIQVDPKCYYWQKSAAS